MAGRAQDGARPFARFTLNRPAASAAPVPPAHTSACARPSPTAFAACTIDASGVARTALTGSALLATDTGASTNSTPSGTGPISRAGPNRSTRTPCSAARAAPAATSAGPRSAPFASTATTIRSRAASWSSRPAAWGADSPLTDYSWSWSCSCACWATTSRPAYVPHTGHTRWGLRGLWQRGHSFTAGASILWLARRSAVRL